MHAAWLGKSPEMLEALEFWLDEILSTYKDVYVVSMYDVLKWMQQPVSIRYGFFISHLEASNFFNIME